MTASSLGNSCDRTILHHRDLTEFGKCSQEGTTRYPSFTDAAQKLVLIDTFLATEAQRDTHKGRSWIWDDVVRDTSIELQQHISTE
mmetsp:Transcript_53399/g.114200  ORF Transcript_53399/g.114200 Transcript_53399/m.114200 type:complete len:86 (-) Transcript_53399:1493-1750(-)